MSLMDIAKNPPEPFNSGVKDGSSGNKLKKIMEDLRPEAVYFTEMDGKRTMVMIIEMKDPSQIPSIAEPFFLGVLLLKGLKIPKLVNFLLRSFLKHRQIGYQVPLPVMCGTETIKRNNVLAIVPNPYRIYR